MKYFTTIIITVLITGLLTASFISASQNHTLASYKMLHANLEKENVILRHNLGNSAKIHQQMSLIMKDFYYYAENPEEIEPILQEIEKLIEGFIPIK